MLSIGLMSGTSMDGIDAALLNTDGENTLVEQEHVSMPYAPEVKILLKSAERAVKMAQGDLALAENIYMQALRTYLTDELQLKSEQLDTQIQQLSTYLATALDSPSTPLSLAAIILLSTQLHADAVKQLLLKTARQPKDIDVIGYHGQTLYHQPTQQKTIQIGHGKQLAALTGITVVHDFRSRDIAAGGQGAPLAPIYHRALAIRDKKIPIVLVNCGGIANASFILSENLAHLIGFDTGPGNGLIDRLVKQRTNGLASMDRDGQYGLQGHVHEEIIEQLFDESMQNTAYFRQPPPKSLDIRDLVLIPVLDTLSLADACATLEAFTAETIVRSLNLLDLPSSEIPRHWVLTGGGGYNPVIKRELAGRLQASLGVEITLETADEAGWNSSAMEAQLMAYLAVRSLKNLPFSTPKTTGVPTPLSGGKAHLPPRGATPAVKALLLKKPYTEYF